MKRKIAVLGFNKDTYAQILEYELPEFGCLPTTMALATKDGLFGPMIALDVEKHMAELVNQMAKLGYIPTPDRRKTRNKTMTSKEILDQLQKAVKKFGEYSLHDKGASEIMDIDPIVNFLQTLPPEQARQILEEVHDNSENGAVLARDLVSDLDSTPNYWFTTLLESKTLQELY